MNEMEHLIREVVQNNSEIQDMLKHAVEHEYRTYTLNGYMHRALEGSRYAICGQFLYGVGPAAFTYAPFCRMCVSIEQSEIDAENE